MSFVLDSNVISELRKAGRADGNVRAWARSVPAASLYISVITVLELEKGVRLAERRDPAQGAVLRRWLDRDVVPGFAGRILEVDLAVARCCAGLHVPDPKAEGDALIAATAIVNGFSVVTRNVQDFERCGVPVVNPWE